jgi:hypothetical protein
MVCQITFAQWTRGNLDISRTWLALEPAELVTARPATPELQCKPERLEPD